MNEASKVFWPFLFDGTAHKCAIPARPFLILSRDCKVSRYFGIVLSLILNLENFGIDIGIAIEFRLLRYWYQYWYPFSNSDVLELILVLNSKTFSIDIVINIEIIGTGIDKSIVGTTIPIPMF